MSDRAFPTSLRRDPAGPRDLIGRIEAQVRERIEEALDLVALEALVERRRRLGRPLPAADSAADRAEFEADVLAFLERLDADLVPALPATEAAALGRARAAPGDDRRRLLAVQVLLARRLPDYWQRFEDARRQLLGALPASGGDRRGLIARLLGGR